MNYCRPIRVVCAGFRPFYASFAEAKLKKKFNARAAALQVSLGTRRTRAGSIWSPSPNDHRIGFSCTIY